MSPAPESVLVIRLGAVGDIVRTLPALHLLRRTWPRARIAWVAEPGPAKLLEGHAELDELIVLERGRIERAFRRSPAAGLRLARAQGREVASFGAELAIDFQASLKSAFVMKLSRARRRVGFARRDGREGSWVFANERLQLETPRVHRVERAVALARFAGAEDDGARVARLPLTPAELAASASRVEALAGGRPALALAPFSSKRQAYKRYPLERWAKVARLIAEGGASVLVLSGPGEQDEAHALIEAAGPHVFDAEAGSLRDLAATVGACQAFVGGDTGPMHIAWSFALPCVVVYGPTDPVLNAPFGEGHVVLAPPERSGRRGDELFPGITPELVAGHALERLAARAGTPGSTSRTRPRGAGGSP